MLKDMYSLTCRIYSMILRQKDVTPADVYNMPEPGGVA